MDADNIVKKLVVVNLQDDVDEYFIEIMVILKPAPQLVRASQITSEVQIISPAGLSNVASLSFPRYAFQVNMCYVFSYLYIINLCIIHKSLKKYFFICPKGTIFYYIRK